MRNNQKSWLVLLATLVIACGENEEIQKGQRIDVANLTQTGAGVSNIAQKERPRISNISVKSWPQHLGGETHEAVNAMFSGAPRLVGAVNLGVNTAQPLIPFIETDDVHRSVLEASLPIVVDNMVYLYDSEGYLHGVSSTGRELWKTSLIPSGGAIGDGFGGGLAYSSGRIYAATGYGELVAVDASSGKIAWRYVQNEPLRQAPLISGNHVIVISGGATAIALEQATGAVAWRNFGTETTMPTRFNSGVPAGNGNSTALAYASGLVSLVDIGSGAEIWNKPSISDLLRGSKSVFSDVTGDPVIIGNQMIVGNSSGILSLDMNTGDVLWVSDIGTKGPLVVTGNSIFGLTPTNQVFRMSAVDGSIAYKKSLPKREGSSRFTALNVYYDIRLAQNALWVANANEQLLKIDMNSGAVVQNVALPVSFAHAPIFAGGLMVGVGVNGQLLIYR